MTERLYYGDSYTTHFFARILDRLAIEGRPAVVLDRTYFYPTGGGQPNDLGKLSGAAVVDVIARPDDHAILHAVDGEIGGETVEGIVDWTRRFDHMQAHTGQHILTRAFMESAGANTVSFHLSPDSVTIDLDRAEIPTDVLDKVEDLANQIVQENRPVTARIISMDEASKLDILRMRKVPDALATDGLRVVEVEGFDLTACGGTHIARAGEIGMIKIIKVERRGAESRVEFRCGGRALADYRLKNAVANQLASDLTVGHWEIDQAVARLRDDLRESRSALKAAQERLVEYEALSLLAGAHQHADVKLIKVVFADRDVAEVRAVAGRLTEEPATVVLMGVAGEKSQLICARSSDLPHDMNAALKRGLAVLKTDRGGGRPEFTQGGGVAATAEDVTHALDEAEKTVFGG